MRSLPLPPRKRNFDPTAWPVRPLLGAVVATCILALTVQARDRAKTRAPFIGGRSVPELVLTVPLHLGGQVPGMLIRPEMTVLPNRFKPVREDGEGIYYQAVSQFMPGTAT